MFWLTYMNIPEPVRVFPITWLWWHQAVAGTNYASLWVLIQSVFPLTLNQTIKAPIQFFLTITCGFLLVYISKILLEAVWESSSCGCSMPHDLNSLTNRCAQAAACMQGCVFTEWSWWRLKEWAHAHTATLLTFKQLNPIQRIAVISLRHCLRFALMLLFHVYLGGESFGCLS